MVFIFKLVEFVTIIFVITTYALVFLIVYILVKFSVCLVKWIFKQNL